MVFEVPLAEPPYFPFRRLRNTLSFCCRVSSCDQDACFMKQGPLLRHQQGRGLILVARWSQRPSSSSLGSTAVTLGSYGMPSMFR